METSPFLISWAMLAETRPRFAKRSNRRRFSCNSMGPTEVSAVGLSGFFSNKLSLNIFSQLITCSPEITKKTHHDRSDWLLCQKKIWPHSSFYECCDILPPGN